MKGLIMITHLSLFRFISVSVGLFQQAPCQWPGRIDNGRKVGRSYKHGDRVQYVCNNAYILDGKQNRTCGDGVWSSLRPACRGSYAMQTSKTLHYVINAVTCSSSEISKISINSFCFLTISI